MDGAPEHIKARQLMHFYKADPAYGRGAAENLGMDMSAFSAWADLPLQELFERTSEEGFVPIKA